MVVLWCGGGGGDDDRQYFTILLRMWLGWDSSHVIVNYLSQWSKVANS